jgi:hypothetical protein
VHWDVGNPLFVVVTAAGRALLSFIFLGEVIVAIVHFTRDNSIEKNMTTIFTILSIGYLDPFYIAQLFSPSKFRQSFHLIARDLYFAGLAFYSISLFAYFTPHEGRLLNLGFPGCLSLTVLIFLILQDFYLTHPQTDQILPPFPPRPFDRLTISHFYAVTALAVILIVRAIEVRSSVTDTSLSRYRFYTITSLVFYFGMVGFVAAEAISDCLPAVRGFGIMACVTSFALFTEYLHSESDEHPYGAYAPNEPIIVMTTESDLGIEEDYEEDD